jgi:ABC-type bacteriocin/lantibiotic exporter with double-glycine peptidase domain
MLLAYVDVNIEYGRLLRILNVRGFGTSGRNLRQAKQIGVEVIYREGSISILENIIASGRPCIALVQTEFLHYWTSASKHAVVVVGIDEERILLNDPAFIKYPMRVTKLEFELAWMELDFRYCLIEPGSMLRA